MAAWPGQFVLIKYITTYIVLPMPRPARSL